MALKRKKQSTPPALKLLKLPFVALREVMSHWDFRTLFNVSMCSEKTQKVISFVGKSPSLKIDVDILISHKAVYVYSKKGTKMYLTMIWHFRESQKTKTRGRQMRRIGGIEMDIRKYEKTYPTGRNQHIRVLCLISYAPLNLLDVAMNASISHLLDTFRHQKIDAVKLCTQATSEKFRAHRALKAVKSVSTLELHACTFDSKHDIQHVLSNIEVTENLEYYGPVSIGTSIEDKLNCSKRIECTHSSWMRPEALFHMNCEIINLSLTRFTSQDIQEFLRRWMDSEGKDKIRYVQIEHPFGVTLDYEALNAKPWDPAIRPAVFKISTIPEQDCAGGMDIPRSDGRIGTIFRASDTLMYFLVWLESVAS